MGDAEGARKKKEKKATVTGLSWRLFYMQKFDERGRLDPRGILMQKLEGERFSEGLERGSDDVGQAAVSFAQGFSSGAPLQKDSSLHQNWGLRSRGRGSRKKK